MTDVVPSATEYEPEDVELDPEQKDVNDKPGQTTPPGAAGDPSI